MPVRDLLSAASGLDNFGPSDPNFENVSLLLNGDGTNGAQNNTFLDSSTNNFTITRNGNTTQGSFSPYGSNWSNYFGASSAYLSLGAQTALNISGGNWTIEFWYFRAAAAATTVILENNTGGVSGYSLQADSSNNLLFYQTSLAITSSSPMTVNAWNHCALVRNGSTTTMYINGSSVGTSATDAGSTNQGLWIGARSGGNYGVLGYLSNVRIVKGTAVYTSTFTPPTTPLTAITNTSLLTCQSNRFIDNSSNAFAITVNGTPSVQRFSPFNPTAPYSTSVIGGSGYFDGSGDYLASSVTAIGTSDFTIEYYSYLTAHSGSNGETGYFQLSTNSNGISTSYTSGVLVSRNNAAGNRYLNVNINGTGINSNYAPPLNEWFHTAIVRQSNTVYMYINGNLVITPTANSANLTASYVGLGGYYDTNYLMTGYLSGFRLVNSAVYTSTFTPPTAPPTPITSTGFLANFTNAGIPDLAMQNNLETVGNAQVSTSVKKYGTGSLAFDGTGDTVFAPNGPITQFGSGNFTVEMWLYPNSVSTNQYIFSTESDPDYSFSIIMRSDAKIGVNLSNNGSSVTLNAISSATLSTSTWYHIAVVRNGTTITTYINGTSSASGTFTGSVWASGAGIRVGARNPSLAPVLNGNIDDLRITLGLARYTANFTPPTAALPTY